ncbi:MAG: PD-(D/E)XK nuclease family protein [Candidatus Margulisbacteria bacterium]|nr:PD-(D/E)XK nuclease family protein [Candidatus Margulisiibacteriota bacterium]
MILKPNKWIYDPTSKEPFRLSRSRLEIYVQCPRCFYLLVRHGVKRPGMPAFTLNIAVDELMKKEFDIHRAKNRAHPLMAHYGIDAVPFDHVNLEEWRNAFEGIKYLHEPTNLEIYGGVDDIWVKPDGTLIVVDYKATSTREGISWEGEWKDAYKRQLEIYQWLLRKNGFTVAPEAYLVYANAGKDKEAFDAELEFELTLLEHKGDGSWIEGAISNAHACLQSDSLPESSPKCEWCRYRAAELLTPQNPPQP